MRSSVTQQLLIGQGARLKPTSLSYVTNANVQSNTITIPSGVMKGDLLVLLDFVKRESGSVTTLVPSGFTQIAANDMNITPDGWGMAASYKIATDGDADTVVAGMNSDIERKLMTVFRGDRPINKVTVGGALMRAYRTGTITDTIAGSASVAPSVVLGFLGNSGSSPDLTASPRDNWITGTGTSGGEPHTAWLAWKIYNSAPANMSVRAFTYDLANFQGGCHISCE
jgi:hypothetical protein